MGDLQGFDANKIEPSKDFSAIPAGKYPAIITAGEWKVTKAGTGKFLEIKLQIVDGPCKGRLLWDRLNLQNPNKQAVEISRGTLSAICRAVGVMTPSDTSELFNRPFQVSVGCTTYNGNVQNEVKGYATSANLPHNPPGDHTDQPNANASPEDDQKPSWMSD
jgi:hypothetical protein